MPRLSKMTPKQKLFVKAYIKNGFNGKAAAEKAYNPKTNDSAKSTAHRALQHPLVQEEIKKYLEKEGLALPEVFSKLRTAIDSGLGQMPRNSDALRGLDMLLRVHSAYPEKITKKMSYSVQQHLTSRDYGENKQDLQTITEESNKLLTEVP